MNYSLFYLKFIFIYFFFCSSSHSSVTSLSLLFSRPHISQDSQGLSQGQGQGQGQGHLSQNASSSALWRELTIGEDCGNLNSSGRNSSSSSSGNISMINSTNNENNLKHGHGVRVQTSHMYSSTINNTINNNNNTLTNAIQANTNWIGDRDSVFMHGNGPITVSTGGSTASSSYSSNFTTNSTPSFVSSPTRHHSIDESRHPTRQSQIQGQGPVYENQSMQYAPPRSWSVMKEEPDVSTDFDTIVRANNSNYPAYQFESEQQQQQNNLNNNNNRRNRPNQPMQLNQNQNQIQNQIQGPHNNLTHTVSGGLTTADNMQTLDRCQGMYQSQSQSLQQQDQGYNIHTKTNKNIKYSDGKDDRIDARMFNLPHTARDSCSGSSGNSGGGGVNWLGGLERSGLFTGTIGGTGSGAPMGEGVLGLGLGLGLDSVDDSVVSMFDDGSLVGERRDLGGRHGSGSNSGIGSGSVGRGQSLSQSQSQRGGAQLLRGVGSGIGVGTDVGSDSDINLHGDSHGDGDALSSSIAAYWETDTLIQPPHTFTATSTHLHTDQHTLHNNPHPHSNTNINLHSLQQPHLGRAHSAPVLLVHPEGHHLYDTDSQIETREKKSREIMDLGFDDFMSSYEGRGMIQLPEVIFFTCKSSIVIQPSVCL